jgi:hypothetical protein
MQFAGKTLFAGVMSLALAAPALAQFRMPVFQANPAMNQMAGQGVAAQFGVGGAFGAGAGGMAFVPGLGPAAALTSTPLAASGGLPSYYNSATTPITGSGTSLYGGSGQGFQGFYPPPYTYEDPVGAYYRGIASLTSAYGQYGKDFQQARLMNQEVERSKILTRRQLIEEMRWIQSLQPMSEDIRRRDWEIDLARARKQAPIGDVLSGKSLNVLLTQLKQLHGRGQRGKAIPVDEETLKQINVSPKFGRNIGFIKSGRVRWPIALTGDQFTRFRETVDVKLEEAINRARINGKVDAVLMKDLDAARKGMEDTLEKTSGGLSLSQYMEAKRYLSYLAEGLRALEEPDVQNFFNRKYEARGKTIPDLVDYMIREGLVFVDAVPGGEGPYRTLYNYLSAYEEDTAGTTSGSPR